jgi:hypothetical protein
MLSRLTSRQRPDHAAIRVPRKAPRQKMAITPPKRATPSQYVPEAASPRRVVLPLMNDMNSCEYSMKPMASAVPAMTANATANRFLVLL